MLRSYIGRGIVTGTMAFTILPFAQTVAHADPPVLPFIPGVPGAPFPGAYTYEPYTGYAYAPRTTDTRGVRTGAVTADPTSTSVGLPGTKPGPSSPNQTFWFTYANSRYGIQGGVTPPDTAQAVLQSASGTLPGMLASGGQMPESALENPGGAPPKTATAGEVTNQTPPSYPQLEPPSAPTAEPAAPAQ